MTSETNKAKTKLASLSSSLDELEAQLEPLFSQTLAETIVGLEPIQQAKLQTVLPYLVYDLIFIYLKTRGIDPKTHPVVPELDRIRQYFEKINNAENPPAKRTTGIDKAAASRFIKHAISQAQWTKTAAEETELEPSTSNAHIPAKVTSKMAERSQYEKHLKDEDAEGSDADDLEVFADDDTMEVELEHTGKGAKGKEKEVISGNMPSVGVSSKRRRPAIDPFTGNSDGLPSEVSQPAKKSTPSPLSRSSESSDMPSMQAIPRKKNTHLSASAEEIAVSPGYGPELSGISAPIADGASDASTLLDKPKAKKKSKKKAMK